MMRVDELKKRLAEIPDDWEIYFSAHPGLTFCGLKVRGDKLVQMQFNEVVWKDDDGVWHVEAN
jgi:hypothetical protein